MVNKILSLVQGKEVCKTSGVKSSDGMCDNLISRLKERINKEIIVFGKSDAFYVCCKLLDLGMTNISFQAGEDENSFKFSRKESEEEIELEIEGVYVID